MIIYSLTLMCLSQGPKKDTGIACFTCSCEHFPEDSHRRKVVIGRDIRNHVRECEMPFSPPEQTPTPQLFMFGLLPCVGHSSRYQWVADDHMTCPAAL